MEFSQWLECAKLYRANWPQAEMPDETIVAWYDAFVRRPAVVFADVSRAIMRLARSSTHPPTLAEIIDEIERVQSPLVGNEATPATYEPATPEQIELRRRWMRVASRLAVSGRLDPVARQWRLMYGHAPAGALLDAVEATIAQHPSPSPRDGEPGPLAALMPGALDA